VSRSGCDRNRACHSRVQGAVVCEPAGDGERPRDRDVARLGDVLGRAGLSLEDHVMNHLRELEKHLLTDPYRHLEGNEGIPGHRDDGADAEALYTLLENEVIPLYYLERSDDNIPREWLGRVRESIRTLAPRFSMRRMLREYVERMYHPAEEEVEAHA